MGNVWPKNDWNTRGRVLFGLGLLVGGKVRYNLPTSRVRCTEYHPDKLLNVQVPQLFKSVIDTLNVDIAAGSTVWIVAGSIILGCMSQVNIIVMLQIQNVLLQMAQPELAQASPASY